MRVPSPPTNPPFVHGLSYKLHWITCDNIVLPVEFASQAFYDAAFQPPSLSSPHLSRPTVRLFAKSPHNNVPTPCFSYHMHTMLLFWWNTTPPAPDPAQNAPSTPRCLLSKPTPAMFLHAGVVHFLFNMLGFLQVGSMVERTFGWRRVRSPFRMPVQPPSAAHPAGTYCSFDLQEVLNWIAGPMFEF